MAIDKSERERMMMMREKEQRMMMGKGGGGMSAKGGSSKSSGNGEWRRIFISGTLASFVIMLCDFNLISSGVARYWNRVLLNEGIRPSIYMKPYFLLSDWVLGMIFAWTYLAMSGHFGKTTNTVFKTAFVLWLVSRVYGLAPVIMKQTPAPFYVILSVSALIGLFLGGLVCRWYLDKK